MPAESFSPKVLKVLLSGGRPEEIRMEQDVIFEQRFQIQGGDFINAGEAACRMRNILKDIGVDAEIVRRFGIAAYEAEMNVVMYAKSGLMSFRVSSDRIILKVEDKGQGISDIRLAMQPGYSTATKEMREMGFGAGMGLPNIRKNADTFNIISK
jgi:anti-sigma regulatory factor (Ser/Thr protein kinase)